MNLTPREKDKLLIAMAAIVARNCDLATFAASAAMRALNMYIWTRE